MGWNVGHLMSLGISVPRSQAVVIEMCGFFFQHFGKLKTDNGIKHVLLFLLSSVIFTQMECIFIHSS